MDKTNKLGFELFLSKEKIIYNLFTTMKRHSKSYTIIPTVQEFLFNRENSIV